MDRARHRYSAELKQRLVEEIEPRASFAAGGGARWDANNGLTASVYGDRDGRSPGRHRVGRSDDACPKARVGQVTPPPAWRTPTVRRDAALVIFVSKGTVSPPNAKVQLQVSQ